MALVTPNFKERLREASKIVWRGPGEIPVELEDVWQCMQHAGRGGLRAIGMGLAVRSAINLLLLLIRIRRVPKDVRLALIRCAIFGEDTLRFAAVRASFVAIYKLIFNALPILLSAPKTVPNTTASQCRPGLSLPSESVADESSQSMSAPRLQKTIRWWYSLFAGAIGGGIAITFEKRGRRLDFAQEIFASGLQGLYHTLSAKHGIRIPHGDVLVFAFCCGQIMYSFFLRQDTLPRSYINWIQKAAMISPESVSINRDLVREGFFKLSDLDAILVRSDVAAPNRTELLARRALAALPIPSYGPRYVPCSAVHPWSTSCAPVSLKRFVSVFRWILPIYGAIHFIPTVLFRRTAIWKDPAKMLLRAGVGTARTSAFLGAFVVICQASFCARHNAYLYLSALRFPKSRTFLSRLLRSLPQSIMAFLVSKPFHWFLGSVCGLALFFEEKRRREEMLMYMLPKALGSAWTMASGKGLLFRGGESGEVLLGAIGMGMLMTVYQNDPRHLSGLAQRILYQFVGPN